VTGKCGDPTAPPAARPDQEDGLQEEHSRDARRQPSPCGHGFLLRHRAGAAPTGSRCCRRLATSISARRASRQPTAAESASRSRGASARSRTPTATDRRPPHAVQRGHGRPPARGQGRPGIAPRPHRPRGGLQRLRLRSIRGALERDHPEDGAQGILRAGGERGYGRPLIARARISSPGPLVSRRRQGASPGVSARLLPTALSPSLRTACRTLRRCRWRATPCSQGCCPAGS